MKELTVHTYRHSNKLYYTSKFADLMLSLLLINQGMIKTTVDALYTQFASTSVTGGLLPQNRLVWNDITDDIINHEVVRAKCNELKRQAASAGEYEVISHQETFKLLFSLIGQKKMSQRDGEYHSLYTFRGFTGCTLGVSPQRSTSEKCFIKAVQETFNTALAAKVKFIFSDSPTRIYHAARIVFKSLLAVGEDAINLPIRLEYC